MVRGEGRKAQKRGAFGTAHKLPSGRYRAMYFGPDGRRYNAPKTFLTEKDARGWLSLRQAEIIRKAWTPPEADETPQPKLTFKTYADTWIKQRDLKDRTREHYEKLLEDHIMPKFGPMPIASITTDDVRAWHAKMGTKTPTLRAHCYGLLRTIMGTAASDGKITANPCVIRGAGTARRIHKIRPASLEEIEIIASEMPKNQRMMVLLAAWCALRFGELTELRRKDVTINEPTEEQLRTAVRNSVEPPEPYGTIRVERAVVRVENGFQVTTPKSDAGQRDVEIPPHLLPALKDHLDRFVGPEKDALLFPAAHGGHLAPASLYRQFYKARSAAKRDDLRWHDLRHSGAVLAAATGATLAGTDGAPGTLDTGRRDALPTRRARPRSSDSRAALEARSERGCTMKYAMICCTGEALAYIDVPRRGSVTVTPASERPHMSIAVNPVIDGKQVWTAEQMHEMTTAGAVERHVTEIQWASHRGWIVRCGEGTCSQQVELSNLNLRKLADLLAGGAWPEVDGMYIVPLRVLNPILRQLNR